MSVKNYCLIPHDWSLEILASHPCNDSSHVHLSNSQAYEHQKFNLVELVRHSDRRIKGVLRIRRTIGIRGLSCKLGEPLAVAVQQKEPWAQVMLAHIQMRRESASSTAALKAADELLSARGSAVYAATIL